MARGDPRESLDDHPVRLFSSDDHRLPKKLKAMLQGKIDLQAEEILHGQMSKPDYKWSTGYLAGLREALALCEEIAKELGG